MYIFNICYGAVDLFIILNISVNISAGVKKIESHFTYAEVFALCLTVSLKLLFKSTVLFY